MKALLRLLLFALFVFLVVTVAAFVYLEWWQAILVSFGTFLLIVYAGKLMVRSAVARITNFASELFRVKSQVLKGATVDVHSVRLVPEPEQDPDEPELAWYEIEATIFPAASVPGPMTHWDLDDLRLVPASTPDRVGLNSPDIEHEMGFDQVWLIENGAALEPEQSKFHGPQRLRFTTGLPKGVTAWKFRYYFEQFGRIELPVGNLLR